jgi:hypothetical protein
MNGLEKLAECARLRGVENLIHRTIHEYDWFIHQCIFTCDRTIEKKWVDKYHKISTTVKDDVDELEKTIDLFYEYCKEEYRK